MQTLACQLPSSILVNYPRLTEVVPLFHELESTVGL
jgi:hypothetical protein